MASAKAQTAAHSNEISTIDSVIAIRKLLAENQAPGIGKKELKDTTFRMQVTAFFENEQLLYFTCRDIALGGCEKYTTFHLLNNELIYCEYILSDPDLRSMKPPATTCKFYFINGQLPVSKVSTWPAGPEYCNGKEPGPVEVMAAFNHYMYLIGSN